MSHLLATVWMAVGVALTERDPELQRRITGVAAFYAIVNNPLLIRKLVLLKIIIRSVLSGPSYARLTTAIKTIF